MLRTQFINAITPFATGGQPYQIYYLVQQGFIQRTSRGRKLTPYACNCFDLKDIDIQQSLFW